MENKKVFTETPDTIHGRLLESVHVSGYSKERAIIGLKWLLQDDRWKKVGGGFEYFKDFMLTINVSQFNILVQDRKEIVKLIDDINKREEKKASQRVIADALGVNEITVSRDLGNERGATNVANENNNTEYNNNNKEEKSNNATNVVNTILSKEPEEIIKPAEKKVNNENKKANRINEENELRKKEINDIEIRKGDFKNVLSDIYNIDAIITDPPYPYEHIKCFSDLSLYAKEHLKDGAFCVVYSGQFHIPEVLKRLSEHLTYVWTFCLYHSGKTQLVNGINIMCGWKPIFIFSKGNKKMRFSANDVTISEKLEKSSHEWQQSESGVKNLIEIFSKPADLIVDPFAGSGTFLKVAKDLHRNAIGADIK